MANLSCIEGDAQKIYFSFMLFRIGRYMTIKDDYHVHLKSTVNRGILVKLANNAIKTGVCSVCTITSDARLRSMKGLIKR